MRKHYLKTIFCLALLSISLFSGYGQNDSLLLKNNDRLVGEVKKMENGILTFKTEYSDQDFKIDWIDVVTIKSTQFYLISTSNGDRYTSNLNSGEEAGKVTLDNLGAAIDINVTDIVYIKPVELDFISRLDASVSFGLNLTKSNNLKQLTVRSSVGYTSKFWQLSGAFDVVRSDQDDSDEIQRTDANLQFNYFLKNDMFAAFKSEFLSNDEQKLALRVTNRVGIGKFFLHSNRLYLGSGGGLAWNNEQFTDSEEASRNSVEAFATVELNIFDMKDFDLLTNFTTYPSLTERGRWRIDYKLDLKFDLPLDFFIKAGVTYNFDNQPVEGGSKNDYVIQTTFGWEL